MDVSSTSNYNLLHSIKNKLHILKIRKLIHTHQKLVTDLEGMCDNGNEKIIQDIRVCNYRIRYLKKLLGELNAA